MKSIGTEAGQGYRREAKAGTAAKSEEAGELEQDSREA